eukprot:Hpha_TRINITY_DN14566_c0_g1::TRINITY_DN14566_c0_g1_i1::g.47134::m.47134
MCGCFDCFCAMCSSGGDENEPYEDAAEDPPPCCTLWIMFGLWCSMCTGGIGVGVAYLGHTERIIFFTITTFFLSIISAFLVKKYVAGEADKLALLVRGEDDAGSIDEVIDRVQAHRSCLPLEETWALKHSVLHSLRRIKREVDLSVDKAKEKKQGQGGAASTAAAPAASNEPAAPALLGDDHPTSDNMQDLMDVLEQEQDNPQEGKKRRCVIM